MKFVKPSLLKGKCVFVCTHLITIHGLWKSVKWIPRPLFYFIVSFLVLSSPIYLNFSLSIEFSVSLLFFLSQLPSSLTFILLLFSFILSFSCVSLPFFITYFPRICRHSISLPNVTLLPLFSSRLYNTVGTSLAHTRTSVQKRAQVTWSGSCTVSWIRRMANEVKPRLFLTSALDWWEFQRHAPVSLHQKKCTNHINSRRNKKQTY